ncbi:MAG: MerR family transcriptional regulator [Lachnospiraceae bacterium]|nr:MerR family transcriptional regulator [Lachnospiraceae bacterium]
MGNIKTEYRVGELSKLTNVKAGTIRFYERCGFLSPVKRLPNGYRAFEEKHIYQVRICSLVFGGFVNKRLRKISMSLISSAREWDLGKYQKAAADYLRAVKEDIAGTKRAIKTVRKRMGQTKVSEPKEKKYNLCPNGGSEEKECSSYKENPSREDGYSKKQAAALIGVTPESIRNWERNGLLDQAKLYQKRYYSQNAMERMYVIRLLLDNGYSMMAVRSFFAAFDAKGTGAGVVMLTNPGESQTLIYRADRYLETLLHTRKKAEELCGLFDEMCILEL